MKKETIVVLLKALRSHVAEAQNRDKWVIAGCPFAPWRHEHGTDKNPSFAVKIKPNGRSHFNCFSCGSHGDLMDLVMELGQENRKSKVEGLHLKEALQLVANELDDVTLDIPDYEEEKAAKHTKVEYWPEWWLDSFKSVVHFPDAMEYLDKRSVGVDLIKAFDLRFDSGRRRVCFPVRDWDGFLVGFHGRAIDPTSTLPYLMYTYLGGKNTMVWLGEHWLDVNKPVLLVESVFDLASVYRVYRNSACSLSAGISMEKMKRMRDALDVVTLYDNDKAGDQARKRVSDVLTSAIIRHRVPPMKDQDPGEMSIEQLQDALGDVLDLDEILD